MPPRRFSISFDSWFKALSVLGLITPAKSYVEVQGTQVTVCMGWAFKLSCEHKAITALRAVKRTVVSRGVHGMAGIWLVNGSGRGLVTLLLDPPQRASMLGFPLKVHELTVSLDDPTGFAAAVDMELQPPEDQA